jgi:hypothetical protein
LGCNKLSIFEKKACSINKKLTLRKSLIILTWSFTVNVLLAKLLKNLKYPVIGWRDYLKDQTYDLRYLETGSALFVFIWSRNRWKSKAPSVGFGIGDTVPLPLGFRVEDSSDLEAEDFVVSNLSGTEFPCCAAKGDDVDEGSMVLAVASIDVGRDRPKGIENVFASAANDGKDDDDVIADADGAEAIGSGDDVSGDVGEEM